VALDEQVWVGVDVPPEVEADASAAHGSVRQRRQHRRASARPAEAPALPSLIVPQTAAAR
jgi:hypothetical protein